MKIILLDLDSQLRSKKTWKFIAKYLNNELPFGKHLLISKTEGKVKVEAVDTDYLLKLDEKKNSPQYFIINLKSIEDEDVLEEILTRLGILIDKAIIVEKATLYFHGNDKPNHWPKLNNILDYADNDVTLYTHAFDGNIPIDEIWKELRDFFGLDALKRDYIDYHRVNSTLLPFKYALCDIKPNYKNQDYIDYLEKHVDNLNDLLLDVRNLPSILEKKIEEVRYNISISNREIKDRKKKLETLIEIIEKVYKNQKDKDLTELKENLNSWY